MFAMQQFENANGREHFVKLQVYPRPKAENFHHSLT